MDTLYKFLKEIDGERGGAGACVRRFTLPKSEAGGRSQLHQFRLGALRPEGWSYHAGDKTRPVSDGPRVHRRELDGQRRIVEDDEAAPSTPAAAIRCRAAAGDLMHARWPQAPWGRAAVCPRWRASPGARRRRRSGRLRLMAARTPDSAPPPRPPPRGGPTSGGRQPEAPPLDAAPKPELRGEPPRGGPTPPPPARRGHVGDIRRRGRRCARSRVMYLQLPPRVHRPFWKSRQMPHAGGYPVRHWAARQEPRGRTCSCRRACIVRSGSRDRRPSGRNSAAAAPTARCSGAVVGSRRAGALGWKAGARAGAPVSSVSRSPAGRFTRRRRGAAAATLQQPWRAAPQSASRRADDKTGPRLIVNGRGDRSTSMVTNPTGFGSVRRTSPRHSLCKAPAK